MRLKKEISVFVGVVLLLQGISAFAYDASPDTISEKVHAFARQYVYKEGDSEKSLELYPEDNYTSGIETLPDGTMYECPLLYLDEHAGIYNGYDFKIGETKLIVNGSRNEYTNRCASYREKLLAPLNVFKEVGCEVDFNEDTYVATIAKNDVVLEILPYLLGMRKNRAEGFYVPLISCARFIDDELYVPVEAIADEFDISFSSDSATAVAALGGTSANANGMNEAIEDLTALNIINGDENGNLNLAENVTRAEMAAIVSRMNGNNLPQSPGVQTQFSDVDAEHWASRYIDMAYQMGVINGYGDGTFLPENPVSYSEAIKMVVTTLGYGWYSEQTGGYPGGYISAMQNHKLFMADKEFDLNAPCTRGEIIEMAHEALDAPIMEKVVSGEGDLYIKMDGLTEGYPLKSLRTTCFPSEDNVIE